MDNSQRKKYKYFLPKNPTKKNKKKIKNILSLFSNQGNVY